MAIFPLKGPVRFFLLPEDIATKITPVFADAMLAHFGSDETITPETAAKIQSVADISPDLANFLYALYTDLPPKDNNLIVDLN